MAFESNANMFSLFDFLDFSQGSKPSYEDPVLDLFEEIPEFSLENFDDAASQDQQNKNLVCPEKSDKESCMSESTTNGSQGVLALQQLARRSSYSSTTSEMSPSEFAHSDLHKPIFESTGQLSQILLEMIDKESLDFILKRDIALDSNLKEFLACNIEVMTKLPMKSLEGESDSEWIARANSQLKQVTIKRKDQKLRMIFNKIVKMLIKNCIKKDSGRESKASKSQSFQEKYAPKSQEEFKEFIQDCKFPSKKKLKSIFMKFPKFQVDFSHVLLNNVFENEYVSKRDGKAQRLVSNFFEAKAKYGNDKSKIVASLKDCIKSFPWSLQDLKSSCALLQSTLGELAASPCSSL